jgi:hypothetical protein
MNAPIDIPNPVDPFPGVIPCVAHGMKWRGADTGSCSAPGGRKDPVSAAHRCTLRCARDDNRRPKGAPSCALT